LHIDSLKDEFSIDIILRAMSRRFSSSRVYLPAGIYLGRARVGGTGGTGGAGRVRVDGIGVDGGVRLGMADCFGTG